MARQMKDSGIEWIGEIPEGWACRKLKNFVSINSGELISKEEYVDEGPFPVIGSNGEIGRTDKQNNSESVITTGRVGTIGTVHIVNDAWITDNALVLRVQGLNLYYLAYVIPNFDFEYMLSGTAQPLITATKLKSQSIPCPTVAEQHRMNPFCTR